MSKESKVGQNSKKIIENSHPQQHLVNIEMTDGSKFQIYTSWGKEGDTLKLDVDPKTTQHGKKTHTNLSIPMMKES